MSVSLAPIQLIYQRKGSDFKLKMKLSSMNFEFKHTTIGPNTSFTTDWNFSLRLEKEDDSFTSFQELNE